MSSSPTLAHAILTFPLKKEHPDVFTFDHSIPQHLRCLSWFTSCLDQSQVQNGSDCIFSDGSREARTSHRDPEIKTHSSRHLIVKMDIVTGCMQILAL